MHDPLEASFWDRTPYKSENRRVFQNAAAIKMTFNSLASRFDQSCLHRLKRRSHQGSEKLAWYPAGHDQALPGHVHGLGRYPESLFRHKYAAASRSAPPGASVRRRNSFQMIARQALVSMGIFLLTLMGLRADFLLRIAANDNNGRQAAYLQVPLRYLPVFRCIADARIRVPVST